MTARRLAASGLCVLVTGAGGLLAGRGASAAFVADAGNAGNRIASGTVVLTDGDGGSPVVSLAGARPGDSVSGCIRVVYGGTLPAAVRLYAATAGSGLDRYLTLTVTRGTFTSGTPAFNACTGFQADASDYAGAGPGVLYSGTLRSFPQSSATAVADPGPWTAGTARAYRFTVTVQSNPSASGLDASASFTWEARSQ